MHIRENPKKKGRNGICRLCLEKGKLCKSHIIPEFHYDPLYNQYHKIFVLATGSWNGPPMIQTGVWERLLCAKCEGKLSQWENYASEFIFRTTSAPDRYDDALVWRNIDYSKFKLYQLSLLWRFGITSKYGYRIDLEEHAEILRKMIFAADPGRESMYPCMILFPQNQIIDLQQWIQGPEKIVVDGCRMVRLFLNGFMWLYFLDPLPEEAPKNLSLTKAGDLPLFPDKGNTIQYLSKLAQDLSSQGKLPKLASIVIL